MSRPFQKSGRGKNAAEDSVRTVQRSAVQKARGDCERMPSNVTMLLAALPLG